MKMKDVDTMMKEITDRFEINKPTYKLLGKPTEVDSSVEAFNLNPPRKLVEHYGNRTYVDRVIIPKDIKFKTLENICYAMLNDYDNTHAKYAIHLRSFKRPGQYSEWCRELENGDWEIRLFCKFEYRDT